MVSKSGARKCGHPVQIARASPPCCTSSQFFRALAGWAVALLKRRPFVFELRDIWPDSLEAVGAAKNLQTY